MKLSAIILSFNSIQYIEQCVSSIVEACSHLTQFEIFVVDNGSTDGSVNCLKQLEARYEQLNVVYFESNTGTTYSRNSALKKATGEFILILDSDAYISKEPLDYLIAYLEKNQSCGLVVPKLTYPDGRFQKSTDEFPSIITKFKRFFFLKAIENKESNQEIIESDVDYAISAFWLMRKDVLDRVGLLDEKIFYSPEDVDYCIRIWKAGYTIHYMPEVSIIHDAQELSRSKGIKINLFTLSHLKGLFYLFFKHGYFFSKKRLYRKIGK